MFFLYLFLAIIFMVSSFFLDYRYHWLNLESAKFLLIKYSDFPPFYKLRNFFVLTFVLISNLSIVLIHLFLIWKIWKMKLIFSRVRVILTKFELKTQTVLSVTSELIVQVEQDTNHLKSAYKKLEIQRQRLKKIIRILKIGYKIWKIN